MRPHVYAVARMGMTPKICAAYSSALLPNSDQSGRRPMGRSEPRAAAATTITTVTTAQITTAAKPR